jgi:RNA polymerase sigma-70 factor (ECF subfamily)
MRSREQVVDEMLVLAAQTGRDEAFELLAKRWHPRLLRHASRLTGDADGAREAAQEAWLSIVRGLGRLHDPACFGAWALRITGRRCADWVGRRQRTRRRRSALAEESIRPQEPSDREGAELVRDALRSLDPERRALLAMFYVEGLTVAEIARVLDVPAGTVKSRLYHARERLRAALEV